MTALSDSEVKGTNGFRCHWDGHGQMCATAGRLWNAIEARKMGYFCWHAFWPARYPGWIRLRQEENPAVAYAAAGFSAFCGRFRGALDGAMAAVATAVTFATFFRARLAGGGERSGGFVIEQHERQRAAVDRVVEADLGKDAARDRRACAAQAVE